MDAFLVSTMVQGHHSQTQSKKLHPFFSKDQPAKSETAAPEAASEHDEQALGFVEFREDVEDRRKRRKMDGSQSIGESSTPQPARQSTIATSKANDFPLDPILRGETALRNSDNLLRQPTFDGPALSPGEPSTSTGSSTLAQTAPEVSASEARQPRKVLKFNMSTGTLGSPPKPKQNPRPSRMVSIKYGITDDATRNRIGSSIAQILDGTLQLPVTPPKKRTRKSRTKKMAEAEDMVANSQEPNDFFAGKVKAKPVNAKPQEATRPSSKPRNTIFMTTPVSPRKPRAVFDPSKVAHFGSQKTGVTKVPGAMHAMWPPQGLSHVLGDESPRSKFRRADDVEPLRKHKGQVVSVSRDEAILGNVVKDLRLPDIRAELDKDDIFPTPPPFELRLPKRHFESGRRLRGRVDSQLKTTKALRQAQYVDELSLTPDSACHSAIASLYTLLESRLSAYDRSTCENLSWTQKYAPTRASEILQSSREGPLLKEWLEALKVQAVDTGSSSLEGKPVSKQENPPKRRKKNKLDGFIVDSDDEADELNCISDGEDEDADSSSETLPSKKTVVRNSSKDSKDNLRLKNALLISGPHGCGKTAAVYAVAQELDYEIFEINSSSRRSGKDLMEKVGDMTRNHLVQRHRAEKTATIDDDEETASDIKSGKQGTMTSFFKPKPGTVEKTSKSSKASSKPQDTLKPVAPKAQKQSLILVEEVDVLYKEDTQFWATLMSMIAQSKRPFILTCNDESLVPIQSLALHGILRFTPPPVDLAVDLCLLVAANEGHALQRDAVEAAYISRGEDLRATLLDLNYWCQLGVGDRRGGFDWFMLRWPRGCDVDDRGDTVRVVSENTYAKGMGWMSRDAIISSCQSLDRDEEVLQQLWNMWQLPAGDWQQTLDLQPWARDVSASPSDRGSKLDLLEAYDSFCDAMSVSDLCSGGLYGSAQQQRIDATLPDLPNKMRDDYILGRQLLEAEPICAQACPSSRVSQCLASLARGRLLQRTEDACISSAASVLNPLTESSAVSRLTTAFQSEPTQLSRHDLSLAFDPLAISDRALINSLDPSVFDRTMRLIVLDVAPYVRGIMAYDNRLMQERTKLSSLLSEGGNGKGRKRMRTTRAALSALEGGERRSTRGEKWFKGAGTGLVMRTGGAGWSEAAAAELEAQSHLLGPSMQGEAVDMDMGEAQIIQHDANDTVGIEHIA